MNGPAAVIKLPRPDMTREAEQAAAAWLFCRGWNPELVPAAAAYYEIDDIDLLLFLLIAIRETVSARDGK